MATEQNNKGPSIYRTFLAEFDQQFEKLMSMMGLDADDPSRTGQAGHCRGMAWCIAVMENPYEPSVDSVREKALERYHSVRRSKS